MHACAREVAAARTRVETHAVRRVARAQRSIDKTARDSTRRAVLASLRVFVRALLNTARTCKLKDRNLPEAVVCVGVVINLLRPFARWLCRVLFKIEFHGVENIPRDGACIITPNHVTYADPIWITVPVVRRVYYMAWD